MDSKPLFRMGPDQSDIRKCRPYFLIPMLHPRLEESLDLHANSPEEEYQLGNAECIPPSSNEDELMTEETRRAFWRVAKYIRDNAEANHPVTDVYVVSHGWHRNFYGAVAAYDRIISRVSLLFSTGRLRPQPKTPDEANKPSAPHGYHPLFLTIHWHSDPGQNGWVDKCGRRHKASFMKNAREAFVPEPLRPRTLVQAFHAENFTKDFEAMYEMMAQISAPDVDALSSEAINKQSIHLSQVLTQYQIRDAPQMTEPEKVAIAWACYHEADPKRVLLPQEQKPGDVIGFRQAVSVALRFAVGALGVAWILGQILSLNISNGAKSLLNDLALGMSGIHTVSWKIFPFEATLILLGIVLALVFFTLLPMAKRWHDDWMSERKVSVGGGSLTEVGQRLFRQAIFQKWLASAVMLVVFALIVNGDFYRLTQQITAPLESPAAVSTAANIERKSLVPLSVQPFWDKVKQPFVRAGEAIKTSPTWTPKQPADLSHYLALYAAAVTLATLYLVIFSIRQQVNPTSRRVRGMPILATLCWLIVEIPLALPIALWLSLTYFFGWLLLGIGWVFEMLVQFLPQSGFLFDERLGKPNQAPLWRDRRGTSRLLIGRLASLPVFFLQRTVPEDNRINGIMDTINSQLAFYEMQRKGVLVGARAAQFVSALYSIRAVSEPPQTRFGCPPAQAAADDTAPASPKPLLHNARLHLLGHSFGSLVVVNLARHLIWEYNAPPRCANNHCHFQKEDGRIDSICLLQGASSSSWFNRETKMLEKIKVLACVYSQYDSANGFLYPLANRGRLAVGNVGMSRDLPGYLFPCYASLVRPPDIVEMHNWKDYETQRGSHALILNIDGSRMIYEGSVAAGGGHDDIFKDEVVHLLWSVLTLTWRTPNPTRQGSP